MPFFSNSASSTFTEGNEQILKPEFVDDLPSQFFHFIVGTYGVGECPGHVGLLKVRVMMLTPL